ncbi:MAG: hypothetical protein EB127_06890 [Alphaproteobacteria bacterium]|nr:hypothetical protein [Alphaproteobacteria bacterium]
MVTATNDTQLKVDVGVLKEQVNTLTTLCGKMDTVIDKILEQQDRQVEQVYKDMDKRRIETESNIKEIHDRIDTVLDKVQASELRLLNEIKELRIEMTNHNAKEKESLDKLLQWKWMVAGGILVVSWLVSHLDKLTFFTKQ